MHKLTDLLVAQFKCILFFIVALELQNAVVKRLPSRCWISKVILLDPNSSTIKPTVLHRATKIDLCRLSTQVSGIIWGIKVICISSKKNLCGT